MKLSNCMATACDCKGNCKAKGPANQQSTTMKNGAVAGIACRMGNIGFPVLSKPFSEFRTLTLFTLVFTMFSQWTSHRAGTSMCIYVHLCAMSIYVPTSPCLSHLTKPVIAKITRKTWLRSTASQSVLGMPCSTPKSEEHWLAMISATLPGKPWSKANQVLINHTLCVDHFIQSFLLLLMLLSSSSSFLLLLFLLLLSLLITMIDHCCSLWLLSLSLSVVMFYYWSLYCFIVMVTHYCYYYFHYYYRIILLVLTIVTIIITFSDHYWI